MLVDQPVVEGAYQAAVRNDGGPAVDPELEVVGVALPWWASTAREYAVPVAGGQRAPLPLAELLGGRVGVQHPLAVEEGGHEGAVAEEPAC